jgi:hypothetical protein
MARCFPAGADMKRENRSKLSGFSVLLASLIFFAGALIAAATVAAARVPGSQAAYGPPPPPAPLFSGPPDSLSEVAPVSFVTFADPSAALVVPAVSAEPVAAEAPTVRAEDADEPTGDVDLQTTPTSSVVESPLLVASSWSMSPLPEGEGGTVSSSTSVDPITPSSSATASPQ